MSADQRPVVVAYDGSAEAQAAVRAAAGLFAGRTLLIVSVWEPGLALAMATTPDLSGLTYMPPSVEEAAMVDRAQRDHAADTANAGAELARELGATAEPRPVPDEVDIAETIASLADESDACAVVVGSRGLGRIKSRLLGSTSQEMLRRTDRPLLVVRAPQ
jgi:nucleotide-binding universal stress UspA family protein